MSLIILTKALAVTGSTPVWPVSVIPQMLEHCAKVLHGSKCDQGWWSRNRTILCLHTQSHTQWPCGDIAGHRPPQHCFHCGLLLSWQPGISILGNRVSPESALRFLCRLYSRMISTLEFIVTSVLITRVSYFAYFPHTRSSYFVVLRKLHMTW